MAAIATLVVAAVAITVAAAVSVASVPAAIANVIVAVFLPIYKYR